MKHKRNDPRGAAKSARRDTHITVFGDSIPKGLYLEGGKVARIEKNAVTLVSDQFGLDIENFSVYGQTLKRCFDKCYFQRWLQENQTRHKVPVISLGGNDSDYDWADVAADPLAEHQPVTPLSEFEDLLDKLMGLFKKECTFPVFTLLPPIDSQRYFQNVISRRADGKKVLTFLHGDLSNIARHQECYSNAILRKAAEHGCRCIDIRTPLLWQRDCLSFLAEDGVHPNAKGHAVIADAVSAFIRANYPFLGRVCAS